MGTNTARIAEIATVTDCLMLKAVMPDYFQFPAKDRLREKQEQSENPVSTTAHPMMYSLASLLPTKMVITDRTKRVLVSRMAVLTSLILLEKNMINIPPINYPTPSKMNRRKVK